MTSLVMPGGGPASSRRAPGAVLQKALPRPVTREPVVVPPRLRSAESRVPSPEGEARRPRPSTRPRPQARPAPGAVACQGVALDRRCG